MSRLNPPPIERTKIIATKVDDVRESMLRAGATPEEIRKAFDDHAVVVHTPKAPA